MELFPTWVLVVFGDVHTSLLLDKELCTRIFKTMHYKFYKDGFLRWIYFSKDEL